MSRLATNETNDAANAIQTQKDTADNKFDPSEGARGVPGRGMTPDVRGGGGDSQANRTAASQRTIVGDGDSDVSDEEHGEEVDDGGEDKVRTVTV